MSLDATTTPDATPTNPQPGDLGAASVDAMASRAVPTPPPSAPTAEPTLAPVDEPLDSDDPNDARLSKVRREAAARRVQAREATAAKEAAESERDSLKAILEGLNKVLNPEAPETVDPAVQVTELTAGNQTLTTENAALRAQVQVLTLAGEHNANPAALLDSRSFTDSLAALDVSADDYSAKVADAIKAAVESNPSLRAVQGTSRGGAENAGGASTDGAVTKAEFDRMGYAERAALFNTNPTLYSSLSGN